MFNIRIYKPFRRQYIWKDWRHTITSHDVTSNRRMLMLFDLRWSCWMRYTFLYRICSSFCWCRFFAMSVVGKSSGPRSILVEPLILKDHSGEWALPSPCQSRGLLDRNAQRDHCCQVSSWRRGGASRIDPLADHRSRQCRSDCIFCRLRRRWHLLTYRCPHRWCRLWCFYGGLW